MDRAAAPFSGLLQGLPGRRWDVLCLGDPCADIVLRSDQLPAPGEKTLGRPLGTFGGGTEANVACAIAALGGTSTLFGRTGSDVYAPMLRQGLERHGVDTTHLAVETDALSACAVAMIGSTGERTIVYLPMPRHVTKGAELSRALQDARIAYGMPYDLDEFISWSGVARRSSTIVAIDLEAAVAPQRDAMAARVEAADIVFFNEAGFRAGTGEPPTERAIRRVLDAGPKVVVVSLGAAGALAMDRGGLVRQAAFPAQVVDTTGAGDTFNAAFLVALTRGCSLAYSLRFACAAASFTVAAMGAREGLPRRHAVESLAGPAPGGQVMPC